MSHKTNLTVAEGWRTLLENHADGYHAMVFAVLTLHNDGPGELYYSSHVDTPEFSHSSLLPGRSVSLVARHLLMRAEGQDLDMSFSVDSITAINE